MYSSPNSRCIICEVPDLNWKLFRKVLCRTSPTLSQIDPPLDPEQPGIPNHFAPCWKRLLFTCGILGFLSCTSRIALAQEVVIVGAKSPTVALNRAQVVEAFLGKMPGIEPVDQTEGSPGREAFYNKVVGKTTAQLKAYWARLEFTGRSTPPRQYADIAEIKKILSLNPKTIAYVDLEEVDSTVRIVFGSD
jgi:hypothetical protein